jgi:hypothetical protein
MRSSSIKSLVITAATVVAFTLITVPVSARQNSAQPVASAPQARENGAFARIKRLYDRFMGPLLNSNLSIPIPAPTITTTSPTNSSSTY